MDYSTVSIDAILEAFLAEVEAFVAAHVTAGVIDEERMTGAGFAEALHLALGERGWVAPNWPGSEGGAGLDRLKTHVIRQALYYAGAPGILASTTLLPPVSIRMFGSEWMQRTIIPEVAAGRVRICLGYTEPDTGSDLAAVRTRAVRDGDHWVVDGQKMFTTGAQCSQYCFLLARSDPDAPKHRGMTVFLVPLDSPGIDIRPVRTLGGERTNVVFYDGVQVDDRYRIGEPGTGWTVVTSGALMAEHGLGREGSAYEGEGEQYSRMLRRALAEARSWADATAKTGASPWDDPHFAEALAELAVHIEACAVTDGPHGRVLSSDFLIRDSSALLEAIGIPSAWTNPSSEAVADGFFEYCYRFAQGTAIYGGTVEIHRNMIAERFLGLPRASRG